MTAEAAVIRDHAALRLILSGGRTTMDRISESLLNEFSAEHGIDSLPEDKRFEHFSSFVTVRPHFGETFDTEDVVCGNGGDTSLDAIAIIADGTLITDIDEFEDLNQKAGTLDVTFVFVQARSGPGFDGSEMANFGFGVSDFFKEKPSLKRNEMVQAAANIMAAIYKQAGKFKSGKPICRMYYVTTGKWVGDPALESRRQGVISDLAETQLFRSVEFTPVDAETLRKLYLQTKNAISREFSFPDKLVLPEVTGVKQAYLGVLPVSEFLRLLTDDSGELIGGLFYDNVRDWQGFNPVNTEIIETLRSADTRNRFALMNNGVTIIARNLQLTGNKFLIEDYSIVNGCQTSHAIVNVQDVKLLDASVRVPVRLIETQDESIINAIIRATNRQTEVKEEQFFALQEFAKDLELYFGSFDDQHKLFYERRSRQYDRMTVEKTRIVTPANMIRAFAAMFLQEPHRTTRNYAAVAARVGKDIFLKGHRFEPYYTAAFSLYELEYLFRSGRLAAKYKPARYHIIMATRLLGNPAPLPRMNANEMEKYCKVLIDTLWDAAKSNSLFASVAKIIDEVAAGNFDRDNIRTEKFTSNVIEACKAF